MILVTGGTGFVGRNLCAKLKERGDGIALLTRNKEKAERLVTEAKEIHLWEPASGAAPTEAFRNVSAIVNLAGETVGQRWNAQVKKKILESRVMGTRNLVDGLKKSRSKVSVLINASAIGYYGNCGNEELSETSPGGKDFLASLCQQWEDEALIAESLGTRVVMIRIGIVLGLGGGALSPMLFPFKMGLGGPIGSGKQWFSWIHIDDLVGLILHALDNKSLAGPINAVAPNPVTNKEFSYALGRALSRPAFLPVPPFALKILFGEFADLGLLASQKVLPQKALAGGYQFKFSLLEPALKEIFG